MAVYETSYYRGYRVEISEGKEDTWEPRKGNNNNRNVIIFEQLLQVV